MKSIKVKYSFITDENLGLAKELRPSDHLFIDYVKPDELLNRIAAVKKDIVHELIKKLPDDDSGILGGPLNRNKIVLDIFTHDTTLQVALGNLRYESIDHYYTTIVVDLPIELITEQKGNERILLSSEHVISEHEIKLTTEDDVIKNKVNRQIVEMIQENLCSIDKLIENNKVVMIYSSFQHGRIALAIADKSVGSGDIRVDLPRLLNYMADIIIVVSFSKGFVSEEVDKSNEYNMAVKVLRSKIYEHFSYLNCNCLVKSEDGTLQYSEAV